MITNLAITLKETIMPTTAIRIPINNVTGGGDYTGQIKIGSQGVVANVILDTGSSTLAVRRSAVMRRRWSAPR